jgi:GDP-4-dehydro-6-deoxy-D-mannose reductase
MSWEGAGGRNPSRPPALGQSAFIARPPCPGPVPALVTGAEGFIGSRLVNALLDDGEEVVAGLYRPTGRYESVDRARQISLDVTQREEVRRAIAEVRPEVIYHLAGMSNPMLSWSRPAEALAINAGGTLHLLDTIRVEGVPARIFLAGSSAEYGYSCREHHALSEDDPLLPVHPYGLSKLAVDLLGLQYHRAYGMATIRGRIFNTIGPRKVIDAPSDFARQLVAVERGERSSLAVGNTQTVRDFTDVRDMVGAIRQVTAHGTAGEVYNLCSGRPTRIQELLEGILAAARTPVRVERSPALRRSSDEPWIVGSNARLRSVADWEPRVPLSKTLEDIVEYWRGAET